MTPLRLVDGQELQVFNQGNGKVAILKTVEDRFIIKFGSTTASAVEVFSVSDYANDVVFAPGVDLLFDGAATIGGNIPSAITLGKPGDTINLNVSGVTYNLPTSGTPYLNLTGGKLTGNLVLEGAELHFNSSAGEAGIEFALKADGEDFVLYEPEDTNREWLRIKDSGESDPTNAMKLFGWNVWHSGNLNPSEYLTLAGGTMSGTLNMNNNIFQLSTDDYIFAGNASYAQAGIWISSGQDIAFNINSNGSGLDSFQVFEGSTPTSLFQIRTDLFKYKTYDIWHSGNFDPASKSDVHSHPYLSDTHDASAVTSAKITNWDTAYTHSQATHARTDATLVQSSATNGNIKINGAETTVYTHPTGAGYNHIPSGGAASQFLQYSASGVAVWSSVDWSELSGKPSTFTPSAHTHAIADTTGLQDALDAKSDVHTHPYLSSSGGVITGDLQLDAANNDRYITFNYTGGAGYSWRIGYIGSGSGDANYFAIETSGEDGTWSRALEIGLTSKKADFKTTPSVNGTLLSLSNHTHSAATTSVAGFMSAADKTKLDGIATNANNYSHPTGDGNLHVPATSTTNNLKVLKAGPTAGSIAWGNVDWAELTGKPSTFTPSAHTHTKSQITDWSHEHTINIGNGTATQISLNTGGRLDIVAGTNISITYDDANDKVTISNSYSHPTGAGYNHIPSGGSASQFLQYSASGVAVWSSVDWSELSGKPSTFTPSAHGHAHTEITGLGDAATKNVGTTAGTVAAGDDSRLSDARTPLAHNHAASDINSGTLGVARGGTGIASFTAGNYLRASASTTLEQRTPAQVLSDIGAAASSHTHSYLPLSGGTMSGAINMGNQEVNNASNVKTTKVEVAAKYSIEYNSTDDSLDIVYIG